MRIKSTEAQRLEPFYYWVMDNKGNKQPASRSRKKQTRKPTTKKHVSPTKVVKIHPSKKRVKKSAMSIANSPSPLKRRSSLDAESTKTTKRARRSSEPQQHSTLATPSAIPHEQEGVVDLITPSHEQIGLSRPSTPTQRVDPLVFSGEDSPIAAVGEHSSSDLTELTNEDGTQQFGLAVETLGEASSLQPSSRDGFYDADVAPEDTILVGSMEVVRPHVEGEVRAGGAMAEAPNDTSQPEANPELMDVEISGFAPPSANSDVNVQKLLDSYRNEDFRAEMAKLSSTWQQRRALQANMNLNDSSEEEHQQNEMIDEIDQHSEAASSPDSTTPNANGKGRESRARQVSIADSENISVAGAPVSAVIIEGDEGAVGEDLSDATMVDAGAENGPPSKAPNPAPHLDAQDSIMVDPNDMSTTLVSAATDTSQILSSSVVLNWPPSNAHESRPRKAIVVLPLPQDSARFQLSGKDEDFVTEVKNALKLQSKRKPASVGCRQARRILKLLELAKRPNASEALFLSGAEAAKQVEPNNYFSGIIITKDQQPLPLQTIADFFDECADHTVKVCIQDPTTPVSRVHTPEKTIAQLKKRFLGAEAKSEDPWNCLELACYVEDGTRPAFLNNPDCRLLTKLKFPSNEDTMSRRSYEKGWKEVEKWILLAQAGALTEPHQDSHGYNTYITVNQGYIGFGWLANPTLKQRKEWRANPNSFTNGEWRYVILKPGQTVYFPSGTVHFVFRLASTGDTLAFGGHVLRCSQILRWAKTMLEEKTNKEVTNEDLSVSATEYLNRVEKFVKQALKNGQLERWGGQEAIDEFLKIKKKLVPKDLVK